MNAVAPLRFQVPDGWKHSEKVSFGLPSGQKLIFQFAEPCLSQWGNAHENYILQQVYDNLGMTLVLLTISVKQYCYLPVDCPKPVNTIQYTMQGHGFGHLKGYGFMPLVENTYTAQYVPEGKHGIFLTPGTHHFFYMITTDGLNLLGEEHSNINRLQQLLEDYRSDGWLDLRLPMDERIHQLMKQLIEVSGSGSEINFALPAIIHEFLRHYHHQLQQHETGIRPAPQDIAVYIQSFIADNLTLSVPELMRQLKSHLFLEPKTIGRYWLSANALSLRTYIHTSRLNLALYLIILGEYEIQDVATQLSYQNSSTFTRQFNRLFGILPKHAKKLLEPDSTF